MSKEREMLRNGLAQFGRGAGALGFDVADLRRILARLEAAERVCEGAEKVLPWLEGEVGPPYIGVGFDGFPIEREPEPHEEACGMSAMVLRDALRAYRDLDAPKQEKP